jgi:transposase
MVGHRLMPTSLLFTGDIAQGAAQARRLLAIAAVLDSAAREEAAKIGGMDRQTLRDWVIRFNRDKYLSASMA